jgi:predicted NBD/HSP70 family sugar kinase
VSFPGITSALLIDVGGTTISAGGVDSLSPSYVVPTPRDPTVALETLHKLSRSARSGGALIIAIPGLVNPSGAVSAALHSPLRNIDLSSLVEGWTTARAVVLNDAKLQALAYLNSRGPHLHVTIGTGVGGAFVVSGSIFDGANGYAGEVGHIAVGAARDEPCPCGRRGCLDTMASGWSLTRDLGDKWWEHTSAKQHDRVALAGKATGEAIALAGSLVDLASYSVAGRLGALAAFLAPLERQTSALERLPAAADSWLAARAGARQLVGQHLELHRIPDRA